MINTSEDFLRQSSLEVELEEGIEIAQTLEEELEKSHNGIGLSAPQIGILKRVVVLKTSNYGFLRLINPTIESFEKPFINPNEGCLSFPGVWIDTIRYNSIVVKDDLNGQQELNNFGAVVAQHECLPRESIIETEDGPKTIGELVDSYLDIKVLSWNNVNKIFEYKEVISFSKKRNVDKKQWVRLKTSKTGPNIDLLCTEDHKCAEVVDILAPEKGISYSPAKDFVGKYLVRYPNIRDRNSEHPLYNSEQLEAIYGSLLGDMCISSRGELISNHGAPQEAYARFKSKYFGGKIKKGYSGFRKEFSNFVSYNPITEQTKFLRQKLYNSQKDISFLLDKLTPLSIAFWYMDDGSLHSNECGCTFHTESFNFSQNKTLSNLLEKKFKIKSSIQERKIKGEIKYNIKINTSESKKLFKLISPFIHYSMEYKLSSEFKNIQKHVFNFQKIPFSCKKINEVYHLKTKQSCLYDLEIKDNHNFIANKSLVHNCDHLDGILFFDRKVPNKYDKCFCKSDKKFKFCCWKNLSNAKSNL